ncbi:MAG: hypothetical protein P8074_10845 [Anaerolineales bacterium]|jgi:cytochrome c biogenesis factor
MYTTILAIHNVLRWFVILAGLVAVILAYAGWFGKRQWTSADRMAGLFFSIGMDLQVLLGLILYFFLSPLTRAVFQNFGAAMSDAQIRFFGLEHIFYMILALILVHVGRAVSRRPKEAVMKHRNAAIAYTLAFVLILIAIPWWRPLIP